MRLKLFSQKDIIDYPFEMDGGSDFGIVNSTYRDQSDIDNYDYDGFVKIFMEISIYNGQKDAIPREFN